MAGTERCYGLREGDTLESLAEQGHGDPREFFKLNKAWLAPGGGVIPTTWNPGMQTLVPLPWRQLPGEYPGPQ